MKICKRSKTNVEIFREKKRLVYNSNTKIKEGKKKNTVRMSITQGKTEKYLWIFLKTKYQ